MTNFNSLERSVMLRVKTIYWLGKFKEVAFGVLLLTFFATVSVTHVLANLVHSAHSLSSVFDFTRAAFANTIALTKMVVLLECVLGVLILKDFLSTMYKGIPEKEWGF